MTSPANSGDERGPVLIVAEGGLPRVSPRHEDPLQALFALMDLIALLHPGKIERLPKVVGTDYRM